MMTFLPVVRTGLLLLALIFFHVPPLQAFAYKHHQHFCSGCCHHYCQRYGSTKLLSTSRTTTIPVLYESDRILIVNKPHGIAHHNNGKVTQGDGELQQGVGWSAGVLQLLREERQQQQQRLTLAIMAASDTQQEQERLWGVHRLDQVTSGILVLAKDAPMASMLSKQFAEGKIQKVYFGLSAKKPLKKKQGWVQGGMERSRDKSWKLVRDTNDNKDNHKASNSSSLERHPNFAKTRFFTARLAQEGTGITVAMFRPFTGKTHQIRVAAKAMGIPLLGDPIYKDGEYKKTTGVPAMATHDDEEETDDIQDLDSEIQSNRTMLHASGIHIPAMNEKDGQVHGDINVWCPPPFFQQRHGTDNGDTTADAFKTAVKNLMIKYCDIPGILEAMLSDEQHEQQQPSAPSQEQPVQE
jgi:23S rRNA-/tRNA-specific pseudouridylate synthase